MKSQAKRLSILSLPEVQEAYSVPTFNDRDRDHFFSFTHEELAVVKSLHTHRNRVHFLLMLGYIKFKPVCLVYHWKDVEIDYQYISQRYYPSASKQKQNISRFTRSRLYKKVLESVDYQRCDKSLGQDLLSQLEERAKYYIDETQLFNDAMLFLKSQQVAVPRYSTLQKIMSKAINNEENRLANIIRNHPSDKSLFLQLIDANEKQCRFSDLKKLPRANKSGENRRELSRYQVLSELSGEAVKIINKLKLTEGNIRYFATRCQKYDIRDLRELRSEKALIYLICFIATRFQISNDMIASSFLVAYKEFDDQTIAYRDECAKQQALELAEHVDKVPHLLNLFTDDTIKNSTEFGSVRKSAFDIISKEKLPLVSQKLASMKPDKSVFQWEYVDSHFNRVVLNIRPLFMALDFGCRSNTVLDRQIATTRASLKSKDLPPAVDGRLVKRNVKNYLKEDLDGDQHHKKIIARRNEMYLYKLLYQGIRSGDVFVKNSLEYRSFDDYLVKDGVWHQRRKHLSDVGLGWMADRKEDHLVELELLFNEKVMAVGECIAEGKNSYVRRKPNADKLLWSRAVTAKDSALTEKFFSHFDRKTIVNVIRKVNAETGFLDHLKPKSKRHKKSVSTIEQLLACLIANGTFQGTHKFSALSGQQYKVLKRIEDDCFHEEALRQAIDTITGSAIRLSIFDDFKLSDGEVHSSADGQRFESKHGNPLVGRAPKYYAKKNGGIVYTLSSSHFATHGKVISARSHESHHLFDVVYNNSSDLKAAIISTDTHGTNQFNHAILNAFGYQFTPRYAKFRHRFLTEFNVDFDGGVALSLAKPINWKLIRSEWENITKIMLSLGMRTVQQSTLVKKLCSFKQYNSTMLALAEYNRVFKCLHLLDYADDKQLRQVIQESLNRIVWKMVRAASSNIYGRLVQRLGTIYYSVAFTTSPKMTISGTLNQK
jgi:TnpA family transposase